MTLLDKLENKPLQELIESREIVSLMVPPYKYRVEEFYNCPVFVSKYIWIQLERIKGLTHFHNYFTRIVHDLIAGSISRVVEKENLNEEIFLARFNYTQPQKNKLRAFRKIKILKESEQSFILILDINEN
ncbi:hypothetical protein LEP1GSC036_0976 [Leptospira weilii str. 2006001853]|uniref:Uncharacterized protein n=2 Tax=Leptospira weilii TaxID=28184 RepID=A0A828Z722_9LEPT|nr:hypothetical protein [Leptospira weilii]EMM70819.1 hypothetical protein LEP1GSC038_2112 [Leptospira weilii str. 2006001855]EKR66180.1 hypothetical protein LEP1GSC036_0976 [Leptospira weilii str. 2006001853]EMN46807.1 hypothetical protein LEP1GSC086_1116 [Leptospira weilii str. LNT 1234]MCL8268415.1 hypothetical protein [Leptospira weilii]QDK22188.1 hypothetical protein FHG67_05165 [Leptospira weilii]